MAIFVSEELADNLAVLGKFTRERQKVRFADRRCRELNEQLEAKVKMIYVDLTRVVN